VSSRHCPRNGKWDNGGIRHWVDPTREGADRLRSRATPMSPETGLGRVRRNAPGAIRFAPAGTLAREFSSMKFAWFIAPLTLAPFTGFAQTSTDPTPLDPVIVTASRTPETQSQSLAATIVIDRAQIEAAQAGDLAELLRFNAGLDIGRNGGPGQLTSIFVRGGNSNHTLVLVDGVRVNPATAGGAALQNLTPEMIERIEVVKGPRSTLYGSDALSAVINIITRAPESGQLDASIRGGSYGTVDGAAGYSQRYGRYGFSVQTEQQRSDGFPACDGATRDTGNRNNSVTVRGSADLGVVQLDARAWNAQGKTEYYDSCSPSFGLNRTAQDFRNQTLALAVTVAPLPGWSSTLTLSRGEDRIRQYAVDDFNLPPAPDTVRTIRPALDWQNQLALSHGFALVFGANAAQERVDALSFGTAIHENTELYNGYVQLRYDAGRQHALAAGSVLSHPAFGERATWNAEYGYDLLATSRYRTTLIGSAGTGFRVPDASDRFGFGGNPELRPERARNYEVGLRQTLGATQRWELRAFRSDLSDLISVQFDPANDPNVDFGFRAVNVNRARNEGVELSYGYDDRRWSARVSGIIQNPKDRSADTQLLRRARRTVTTELMRKFGRYFVSTDLLATSDRPDIDAASGAPTQDGGYVLLNLSAGVHLARGWTLSARAENLLDRRYETAAGYRQPGLSGYATLRYAGGL